jgi:cytochrome c oxidase assembly protein subunit 15
MIVIVLSGAAVRLTGSGLGCPDWPTCFHHRLTGSWSIHPLIERKAAKANQRKTGPVMRLGIENLTSAA